MENKTSDINIGNLYELNKKLVMKEKNLKDFEIKDLIREIHNKLKSQNNKYYCLLCREKYDFTVFHFKDVEEKFNKALFECLTNRGNIKSIEEDTNSNEVYEIWIEKDDDIFAYYLFPYDNGVLEVSL